MTKPESESITRLESKIDKIVRGMYGDDINGSIGLIERQKEDEAWRVASTPILNEYMEQAPKLKKMITERDFIGRYWYFVALGILGGLLLLLHKINILTF